MSRPTRIDSEAGAVFTNVLVGVDNREGGHDAIALSKQFLVGAGELTLAHVYAGEPYVYRGVSAQYEAGERQRHLELLAAALKDAGVRARLCWREASSAGRGLHAMCEEIDADLLVVGSSRRGALRRILFGDDARAALDGAPCAVAVAPAGYSQEPASLSQIGVGYDGSAESRHALEVARGLAAEHGSKVSVFEALEIPRHGLVPPIVREQASTDDLLKAARDRIASLGNVEPYAASGEPARELARFSATVDLLVIGLRSYAPAQMLLHESTPGRLARTALCPLLVVARSAPDGLD
jgi:nucleotide-binding universal stress UspA family protein